MHLITFLLFFLPCENLTKCLHFYSDNLYMSLDRLNFFMNYLLDIWQAIVSLRASPCQPQVTGVRSCVGYSSIYRLYSEAICASLFIL